MAILLYIGTLISIPLIYVLYNFVKLSWQMYTLRKALVRDFPTSKYHWLLGHLDTFPGANQEGLHWLLSYAEKHPRCYVITVGQHTILHLTHPETIKQVTQTREPKPLGFNGMYRFFLPWIGDGLLLSSGNKWYRNRKLLTPGFHFDVLKPYIRIYNRCTDKLIDNCDKLSAATGNSIDIYKHVGFCALDIILQCAFSSKQDIQEKGENQVYYKTVTDLGRGFIERTINPLLAPDFIFYITPAGRKFAKNCTISHQVADDVIQKRKQELKESDTIQKLSTKRYVDFLDILLLAKDEEGNGLTQQEIRDEVETFMFEGHDTTASGTSWILYNLARHPEIQAKARDEIDELLGGRSSDDLEWDDMNQMPYLTRCIKESLRLHPPVLIIGREASKPVPLDDKIIPAGTSINLSIWNMHRNPAVWNDPMTYDPDRFLPENISKMDSHAFMPFSAGPRNCIGQNFAMNEMKTTVARILRRFEMSLDETKEVKLHPDVVLRSETGIHLCFKNRC